MKMLSVFGTRPEAITNSVLEGVGIESLEEHVP
jgi:UDP-N-acetylglucosamine 2-epimerase